MPEPTIPAPPAPAPPATATVTITITIHTPDADNAARWAESIGQLVNAEFSDTMRLSTSSTTPGPSAGRDTMREAIARALAQTDDICGMDHGFTDPCIDITPDAIIDAVLAVRDGEMERLRAEYDRVRCMLIASRDLRKQLAEELAAERTRAEDAEAEVARLTDLMGRYADRGIANGQRAEEAEAKLAAVEQEIRSLHCREKDGTCGACIEFSNERHTTYETWPCSTIRELDDALAAPHGPAGQGDGGGR